MTFLSATRRSPVLFFALALSLSLGACKTTQTSTYPPSRTEYLYGAQPAHEPAAARAIPAMGAPPPSSPAFPANPPTVVAPSAIVLDYATGAVLYEKNADTTRPVASTQKLVTALVIAESGSLDQRVTVATEDTLVEPRKIGIAPGESYTRRELLHALLVRSGNDIAECLARSHSGNSASFAFAMNRYARRLGMHNSNFVNPHGLTAPGQFSTARDLGTLARASLHNPVIAPITRKRAHQFRFSDGRVKTLENTNELLEKSPYCHGMKTGYTRASGRCLISAGTHNGRTVIVVVLRSGWDSVWTDSRKLLHWALGVS